MVDVVAREGNNILIRNRRRSKCFFHIVNECVFLWGLVMDPMEGWWGGSQ
jgi:hypothetical protein